MTELSVSISTRERYDIKEKASELFNKTAKIKHPNPDFYTDITKQIFLDALSVFDDYLSTPIIKFVSSANKHRLAGELSTHYLGNEVFIYSLNTGYSGLLSKNTTLDRVEFDDMAIPNKYVIDDKILLPFKGRTILSEELVEEIDSYNAKMETIYAPLSLQLETLLGVIDECKTTKSFYNKLPNLKSLLPASVLSKIQRKNENGESQEVTEEQQLMIDATNAIATANLLGD